MDLSISNIAWSSEQDEAVYAMMQEFGFKGLEIAPTRIFSENPYEQLDKAVVWARDLKQNSGFRVSSMQSIWHGRKEKLFGTEKERKILTAYTKKAINFAAAVNCRNLVFGCPKNRNCPDGINSDSAIPFFKEMGDYAFQMGIAIGMEANPPIYDTNYINDTSTALKLIREINSEGFKLNLDVGTMLYYQEGVDMLKGQVNLVNHVHLSEPGLRMIEKRMIHQELLEVLRREGYEGFVSIEIGRVGNLNDIRRAMAYVREIFAS